jgi:hypothetical protein
MLLFVSTLIVLCGMGVILMHYRVRLSDDKIRGDDLQVHTNPLLAGLAPWSTARGALHQEMPVALANPPHLPPLQHSIFSAGPKSLLKSLPAYGPTGNQKEKGAAAQKSADSQSYFAPNVSRDGIAPRASASHNTASTSIDQSYLVPPGPDALLQCSGQRSFPNCG